MKVKDIIKVQNAISEAIDFIATNSDGDETTVGIDTITILSDSRKLLQKEKDRIYLNNAKQKLKNRT